MRGYAHLPITDHSLELSVKISFGYNFDYHPHYPKSWRTTPIVFLFLILEILGSYQLSNFVSFTLRSNHECVKRFLLIFLRGSFDTIKSRNWLTVVSCPCWDCGYVIILTRYATCGYLEPAKRYFHRNKLKRYSGGS